ncbi:MAG: hypothetical protein JWP00_1376 [Chloroflexi bacterium]|jgi:hypothetical protein|nr:hypothetical protein [Chloroflexota bacterium]
MHSLSEMDIDQKMQSEQIEEAHRLRPIIWWLIFLAPLGLILGLAFGIWLGGR